MLWCTAPQASSHVPAARLAGLGFARTRQGLFCHKPQRRKGGQLRRTARMARARPSCPFDVGHVTLPSLVQRIRRLLACGLCAVCPLASHPSFPPPPFLPSSRILHSLFLPWSPPSNHITKPKIINQFIRGKILLGLILSVQMHRKLRLLQLQIYHFNFKIHCKKIWTSEFYWSFSHIFCWSVGKICELKKCCEIRV